MSFFKDIFNYPPPTHTHTEYYRVFQVYSQVHSYQQMPAFTDLDELLSAFFAVYMLCSLKVVW